MGSQRESAILLASDIHWGKQTASYDPDICRKRLHSVGERIGRIKELLGSSYDLEELNVCLLGDVNDGTDIYKTQPHHQAVSNVEAQANEVSDYLAGWLREQAGAWPSVKVWAVPGNHGRTGKFAHEAANWDIVSYRYLKLKMGDRVPVNWNEDGDPFINKIAVRRHPFLLYHAHEIRMFQNIPWYGIFTRLMRWHCSKMGPFEGAFLGHFHSLGWWKMNQITAFLTGTPVSDDEWAMQALGMESANQWWLIGTSDKRAVTWSFPLELT